MTKLTQKEAVFNAVNQVLSQADIIVEINSDYRPHMTKEFRAQVNNILFEGFKGATIELDGEKTESELKSYVSGLQSNWLNKDKRLNGNVQYVAKNPGSRAGNTDPQVKALKALIATKTDADEIAEIQAYIDERMKSVGIKTAKTVTVNYADLPADLQAKYAPKTTEEIAE